MNLPAAVRNEDPPSPLPRPNGGCVRATDGEGLSSHLFYQSARLSATTPRLNRTLSFILTLLFSLLLSQAIQAAPSIGAAGDEHAWLVVEESPARWRLIHLPPDPGAQPGQINAATDLAAPPAAIGAIGDRVVLIFDGAKSRTVLTARIVRSLGEVWSLDPQPRLDSWPPLPGGGDLLGIASAADHIAALVRTDGATQIFLGKGTDWPKSDGPEAIGASSNLRLVNDPAALALVEATDQSVRLWKRSIEPGATWQSTELHPEPGIAEAEAVWAHRGALVWLAQNAAGHLILSRTDSSATHTIADLGELSENYAVSFNPASGGTLAILDRAATDDASKQGQFRLVKISAATGTVLFDSTPNQSAPISSGEFRLMAASMLLLIGVILVIAIRPGPSPGAVALPPNAALADPPRRLSATLIDLLAAAFITSSLFGVGIVDLLSGTVMLTPDAPWLAMPAMLAIGALIGTICESLFGRTIGKLLTGCRVVSHTGRRLAPHRALLRNLVKWMLPPIAAMALLDPTGMHRGDSAARACVVVDLEEE